MISKNDTEKLLTVTEVAEILHVHPNTLRRWSDEGKISSFRIAMRGDRRYRMGDVMDFLTEMNPYKDSSNRKNGNGNGRLS